MNTRLFAPLTGAGILSFWLFLLSGAHADPAQEVHRLVQRGAYQQALEKIEEVEKQGVQDDGTLMLAKGNILYHMGRVDESLETLEACVEKHPDSVSAYNNLAVIYAARGDLINARNALERAVTLVPHYDKALANLASLHLALACTVYNKIKDPALKKGLDKQCADMPAAKQPAPGTAAEESDATVAAETGSRESYETAQGGSTSDSSLLEPVVDAIKDWKSAWASQNIEAYLRHYSPRFVPSSGSFEKWLKHRRAALTKPAWITIRISDLKIRVDGDRAVALFKQQYAASNFRDITAKQLVFKKENDTWKIVRELSL